MKGSLAVFPKPAALIKPGKSSFHDPAFRENYELMQFVALDDLNICTNCSFDMLCKRLTHISTITKEFNDTG